MKENTYVKKHEKNILKQIHRLKFYERLLLEIKHYNDCTENKKKKRDQGFFMTKVDDNTN